MVFCEYRLCFIRRWLASVGCVWFHYHFGCVLNKTTNVYNPNSKFWIVLCVCCWFVVVFCSTVFIKYSNTCWLSILCCGCVLLLLLETFFPMIYGLNFVNIVLFPKIKIILFPFSFEILYFFLSWFLFGSLIVIVLVMIVIAIITCY